MKTDVTATPGEDAILVPSDLAFADLCQRVGGREDAVLWAAAALAAAAIREGHSCLDLSRIRIPESGELRGRPLPPVASWPAMLASSPVVGAPGERRPLILDGSRLSFERYWRYEESLAEAIHRASRTGISDEGIDRIVAQLAHGASDEQIDAVRIALTGRFTVVTGGPGTGKTTTALRIIAALAAATPPSVRIALAAPTGKAAARLGEAIRAGLGAGWIDAAIAARIPTEATTLHRLLGYSRARGGFLHGVDNPLGYGIVVVDEASMISLPQTARLVRALAPDARLVLIGDKDQLSSIESGAVLADICAAARDRSSPLAARVASLGTNFRAKDAPVIVGAAAAVNEGTRESAARAVALLRVADAWMDADDPARFVRTIERLAREHFAAIGRSTSAQDALDAIGRLRILTPTVLGAYGVATINATVERVLLLEGVIRQTDRASGSSYRGRPVMATANDYELGIFNGDTGVIWTDPDDPSRLVACFPSPDGGLRSLPIARLGNVATVYAMTVHKSQGSEFDEVFVVAPPYRSRLMTKELLYTAITRAKRSLTVYAREGFFADAVMTPTERNTGLREKLGEQRRS